MLSSEWSSTSAEKRHPPKSGQQRNLRRSGGEGLTKAAAGETRGELRVGLVQSVDLLDR